MTENELTVCVPNFFGTHPMGKAYLTENKVTVYNSPMGRNNQTENEFAVYVPVLWTGTVLMRKN